MRASWDQTWIRVAFAIADRSYDPRLRVGAVVVSADNRHVRGVGYNGNHAGGPHAHESVEPGGSGFVHAEPNALIKAGTAAEGATLYVTDSPCRACAKLAINAGIARVVYARSYRDASSLELLAQAGVVIEQVEVDHD